MESITHFSHEHPLILLDQLPTSEETKLICYGCQNNLIEEIRARDDYMYAVSGFGIQDDLIQKAGTHDNEVYGCEMCTSFFLHKSCTQFPMEIVHKSHYPHSLFLLSKSPLRYPEVHDCSLCRYPFKANFFYHCYVDDFDLHIRCALGEEESILFSNNDLTPYHPSHKHYPLTTLPRPSSFLCDACDLKYEDLSYQCTSCHYWIHRSCAMLPSTIEHDVHTHTLSLSFGLPSQYHNRFSYLCGICEQEIKKRDPFWVYYCHLCRYFVHIKCMAIQKPQIEVDLKDLCIDDLPRLPGIDKSVELIQRFLQRNNSPNTIQQEISIFSHKHPLIYSNEQIIEDEIDDGEQVLCDACIEPIIYPPYYHCAECSYFLHLSCSKLPLELQHPSHPHLLILSSKTRFDEYFKCSRCNKSSNGLFYYCTTGGCKLYLDVKCAALPNIVIHESHNHPLYQRIHRNYEILCRCCGQFTWTHLTSFSCKPCTFVMHLSCLMLPKTRKHRFDSKYLLTLRYPPHYYHPRPFDCAECEGEIDPNYCLYHCEESDLSFHVDCIKTSWLHNNMKFGQKLQIRSHPHPLKFVYRPSVKSPCHDCGNNFYSYFYFECETCNFHLCEKCVKKIEPPSELSNIEGIGELSDTMK